MKCYKIIYILGSVNQVNYGENLFHLKRLYKKLNLDLVLNKSS